MNVQAAMRTAYQERQAGNLTAAEGLCRQILAQQPSHAPALNLLGMLAYKARRLDVAAELIGRAAKLSPENAEIHFNHGLVLGAMGQQEPAAAAYLRCLGLEPASVQALCNLGATLQYMGRYNEAIARYRQVIDIQPQYADAHNNLGSALRAGNDLDGAIECYQRAIALAPTDPTAQNNLANALYGKGDLRAAQAACRAGIALDADFAQGQWTLALLLLVEEDYQHGWPQYEWRLKLRTARPLDTTKPRWYGSDLKGVRLFLHSEQGFGDTLQFIRYAAPLRAMGATVVMACQRELVSLLRGTEGVEETTVMGEALPEFDVHCPLPSVPLAMKTDAGNIPSAAPYVQPDAALVAQWRERIGDENRKKIGLVWAGRLHPDPKRTMPLEALAPLGQIPNVRLFSLQKGNAGVLPAAGAMEMTDWTADLHDFADTAALMTNLDLIITIDTAVAHLAGAMGLKVWTLLPFAPDWRWLLGREDCVWYPTMRLFRQQKPGDWAGTVAAVGSALRTFVA
jgi:tetratricopeptide (TPR) repeat protein